MGSSLPRPERTTPPERRSLLLVRCAFMEGFSLHVNTHVHANDRQGLERLCRYGARGALALERLSRAEDGRIAYRMKRPLPDGTTHLFFTGLELLRRVASLVPPPWTNLTRFHGVFAPGAKLRSFLVPQVGAEEARVAPQAEARKEPKKERTPRVDFRGVAEKDVRLRRVHLREVWRQAAGFGVPEGRGRGASDCGAPGSAYGRCEPGPGARPPRPRGVEAQAATAKRPWAPAAPLMGGRPGQGCASRGLHGLSTRPAHGPWSPVSPPLLPLHAPSLARNSAPVPPMRWT
ncbi:transposase [Archangium sp.]|uniref:transposase n=1 Tax=Archangium sp. TaxID=1872627 RepID=UPI002D494F8F|nr:transposase [Archangium sp.]HYO54752.1 transposase [Archangium sp.]